MIRNLASFTKLLFLILPKGREMTVITEDRPIEAVREEVVDQLTMNYGHGKLSLEAFERRLDQAMECQDNLKLLELTADLDLAVDENFIEKKNQELNNNTDPDLRNKTSNDGIEKIVTVFAGNERKGEWHVAKETHIFSLFGGTKIDLSEAKFNHQTSTIRVFSLFSGVEIFTPEEINVVSKAFCIFGAIDNHAPSIPKSNVPRVVIEGYVLFSGVDVKVKITFKERLIRFADGLKDLFN